MAERKLPSFIVTLATLFAVAGFTLGMSVIVTGSTSVALTIDPLTKTLFGEFIGGKFQVTLVWWAVFVVVFGFLLGFSRYGNWILALGGDAVSARNAGIPTEKLNIALFMRSGFCASFEGGAILTGGYGTVVGIVLGTMTFSIVNQDIFYTGFDANWASLIIGVLLLATVLMNNSFRKMALSYSSRAKVKVRS